MQYPRSLQHPRKARRLEGRGDASQFAFESVVVVVDVVVVVVFAQMNEMTSFENAN